MDRSEAVMWLRVADGVEIKTVWDLLKMTLKWSPVAGYSCTVQDDEIELRFDYGGNETKLLLAALQWGRAESAIAPICEYINIFLAHSEGTENE